MKWLVGLAVVVLLAGCGHAAVHRSVAGAVLQSTTKPVPRAKLPVAQKCPAGQSFMGCSAGVSPYSYSTAPPTVTRTAPAASAEHSDFPDVSSYQGCDINWAKVDARAAVVKLWENTEDPCAAHNIASLKAAHKLWTVYDFVRSCSASGFLAALKRFGEPPLPVVIDEEVAAAAGCTATLAAQIHKALGVYPIEYTSPGTEQSGASADDLELWVAAYGAASAPHLWRAPTAWQFASPPYEYHEIKGLGYGDVNEDLGMLELSTKPKPKPLVCFGAHAAVRNRTCIELRARVAKAEKAERASLKVYDTRGCPVLAREQSYYATKLREHPRYRTRRRRRALVSIRRVEHRRACGTFGQRIHYFQTQITHLESEKP